jgi:hypothetical protein
VRDEEAIWIVMLLEMKCYDARDGHFWQGILYVLVAVSERLIWILSACVLPLPFSAVESVNETQGEPGSENSFPGVCEVVLVSVCNFYLAQGPCE